MVQPKQVLSSSPRYHPLGHDEHDAPDFPAGQRKHSVIPGLIVGVGVFGAGLARFRTGGFLKCVDFALVALGAGILVLKLTGNAI